MRAAGWITFILFLSMGALPGAFADPGAQAKPATHAKPGAKSKVKRKPASDDVPVFRHVHDCNVQLNPILDYVGLGTLTTAKFKGEAHSANIVPAPPATPKGRAGFYVLTDQNQAVFIDVPVFPNEAMKWEESGPFSKTASGVTHDHNFYQDDTLDGRFEVELNLDCTATFSFKDADGTPLRKLVDSDTGVETVGGVAQVGTCRNRKLSGGTKEIPSDRKLETGRIDRNSVGPRVDEAALDDLHQRLSKAMDLVAQNIRDPSLLASRHPEVQWATNLGTKGVEERKNACHLLSTFFKAYNECATQSLGGTGGLGEMAQADPEFHQRLAALGDLYASFREPSDSPECKPPVTDPAAPNGGQSTRAAP